MPALASRRLAIAMLMAILSPAISFAADKSGEATASYETVPPPKPADVQKIEVHPTKIKLVGGDDATQIIVTATLNNGRLIDLSSDVKYTVSDAKLARITPAGRVLPTANGSATIAIQYGDKTANIPLEVAHYGENLPINFPNQIVPVFTKLGCNAGGCHGKASGQNGFKISLLGFEPETDFVALVKEGRGRRLMPAAPDHSLFLLKGIGAVAHGGGKKMEKDSDEYRLVRRWIAAGMPYGKETDPIVTKISVYPEHRILDRNSKQQFAVYAHYSDGKVEDITRRAQYESNDQEIAMVDPNAIVRTMKLSGEAAIMARFQGFVSVFRATVPLNQAQTVKSDFQPANFVDQLTSKKWKELGLIPSAVASDEVFLRRVTIDLTGTLPTPEQVKAFVDDKDAAKRDKLIDRLVDSPEYSYYFANKWADVLRVKRGREGNPAARAQGTFAFHNWIREAVANDVPYDEFVRSILSATGDENKNPPTVWYKDLQNPEQFVDDTAQVFLGLRIACANCHHHPYEKWSQDDYWGMAAFFGRLGRKQTQVPGSNQQDQKLVIYTKSQGNVTNKRTSKPATIKALDAAPMDLDSDVDPRVKLVDWMVDPTNPFFARAVANRYWAHFFTRGIVDPIDDMRVTNPPSNPELLDALSKYLTDNKYSLKSLVKAIVKSRTYQLSAVPNDQNKNDKQAYARYYPKRLAAEVLLDAVCQVTDSPNQFNGLPQDRFAPKRAIMLPDESYSSYFLDVFGRPQRISACECERVSEANLAQSLHLLNSDEIQQKLGRGNARIDRLANANDKRPDAEKVEELFMWTFGRKPSPADLKAALDHVTKNATNKKTAYENILWALINTKEFIFVQ
jgi:hypothetical protein